MTTGPRVRPAGGRRGAPGGFTRRRRGRNALKAEDIDYKDVQLMRRFVSERGKIVSGRRVGVSAKNQRRLARAIKRAQHLALIPFAPNHTYVTGAIQTEAQRRQESRPEEDEAKPEAPAEQEASTQKEASAEQAENSEAPEEAPTEQADATPADATSETPAPEAETSEDE